MFGNRNPGGWADGDVTSVCRFLLLYLQSEPEENIMRVNVMVSRVDKHPNLKKKNNLNRALIIQARETKLAAYSVIYGN